MAGIRSPQAQKSGFLAETGLYPGPQEAFSKAGEGCGCGAQEAIIRRKSLTRRSIIISKNRRILRRRAGT